MNKRLYVGAGGVGAVGLATIGIEVGLSKSEWAAWVQAIGAIIALGVAVAIPFWQGRRATIERRLERADSIAALSAIGGQFSDIVQADLTRLRGWGWGQDNEYSMDFDAEVYDRFIGALDAIPLHGLPDARTVNLVIRMTSDASDCRRLIGGAIDIVNQEQAVKEEHLDRIDVVARNLQGNVQQIVERAESIRRG